MKLDNLIFDKVFWIKDKIKLCSALDQLRGSLFVINLNILNLQEHLKFCRVFTVHHKSV